MDLESDSTVVLSSNTARVATSYDFIANIVGPTTTSV